ncbi:MAG: ATP-binding protein [Defluviitaleaceae bacterium]|nr:ATP-binding protein [Defluviitaleaceae bacterium]
MNNTDCIKLSFPVNPAYVSLARLTVSNVANRLHFGIDDIEDIKTAVSEACTIIIKQLDTTATNTNFEVSIKPHLEEGIAVEILTPGNYASESLDNNEMSIMMIRALVDEFSMVNQEMSSVTSIKKMKNATA